MARVSVVHPPAAAEALRSPRDNLLVRERAAGDGVFTLDHGPFRRYDRRLAVNDDGSVEETTTFVTAAPFWGLVFVPLYRSAFRRADPGRPWWAPPERLDARAGRVMALLLSVSVVGGYLGTVITQTATFAADEFEIGTGAQSVLLGSVRASILVLIPLVARADRFGRRRLITMSAIGGIVATALGALSPNVVALGVTQMVARGFSGALALLVAIMSAEEMPAGSRAWAYSLIAMTQALGAGTCLWVLPLADLGIRAWRILYLIPLAYLAIVAVVARHLPESRRFAAPHVEAPIAGHGRRFWLLAVTGLTLAFFASPASQLGNEFLRDERGFSAADVTIFTLLTATPAVIGVIAGGHLADVRGRRLVGATGIVGGTLLTVVAFASTGSALFLFTLVGNMLAALTVPALGVYRPELFPTSLRGRAAGFIELLGVAGASAGLLLVGLSVDAGASFGEAFAVAAVLPLVGAVLVLTKFPETAHRSLEDINPEDRLVDGVPRHSVTVRRLLVVLAVGFLLPACGDDTGGGDDSASSDSATTRPETTEGSTPATTASEPPEDFTALEALFGPALEEVGLDLTRAAVYHLGNGPHIALYGVPADDADAPADYLDRLLPSAVASGEIAFDRFAEVVSFDLCQEPTGTTSESPPPVTVVFLTRDQWETVPDWDDAGLVDLLEAATTLPGGQVEVPEDIRALDEYDAAAAELADRRGE